MKIIGAGFGRTGTASLKEAFEHLGYPCYHMQEVMKAYSRGHVELWDAAIRGDAVDWRHLFSGYEATVDFPACLYYRELLDAFPDAVVVLSIRDPERWWLSFEKLIKLTDWTRPFNFVPMFRKFAGMNTRLTQKVFGGRPNRDSAIDAYLQHIDAVKANIPAAKLLVYSVTEGWEPLCDFLGLPVPDIPFPHTNAGIADLRAKMVEQFWEHGPGKLLAGRKRSD